MSYRVNCSGCSIQSSFTVITAEAAVAGQMIAALESGHISREATTCRWKGADADESLAGMNRGALKSSKRNRRKKEKERESVCVCVTEAGRKREMHKLKRETHSCMRRLLLLNLTRTFQLLRIPGE